METRRSISRCPSVCSDQVPTHTPYASRAADRRLCRFQLVAAPCVLLPTTPTHDTDVYFQSCGGFFEGGGARKRGVIQISAPSPSLRTYLHAHARAQRQPSQPLCGPRARVRTLAIAFSVIMAGQCERKKKKNNISRIFDIGGDARVALEST